MKQLELNMALGGSRLGELKPRDVNINSERLVTNTLSRLHRVQRWGNFIAGFSVEFVTSCLEGLDPQDGLVLDPFTGCGTTFVASQNLGFSGIGFEPHNIFHTIASAKTGEYSLTDLQCVSERLRSQGEPLVLSVKASAFLLKMFPEQELRRILVSSAQLKHLDERLRPLGVTIFLRACELACGSQTDGIYKAPGTAKKHIPFDVALHDTVNMFLEDIRSPWYLERHRQSSVTAICRASSTDMSRVDSSSAIACITSPPYLNNFDYAEMTRMHSYLLGWATNWQEITETVRLKLVTRCATFPGCHNEETSLRCAVLSRHKRKEVWRWILTRSSSRCTA